MESYSLIIVADETAPIRRFDVQKRLVRRAAWCVGAATLVFTIALVDYVRVRMDHSELQELRIKTAEQQSKIASFENTLGEVDGRLAQLREFERKVRIIANLPGSAATGGTEIAEVGTTHGGDLENPASGRGEIPSTTEAASGAAEAEPSERAEVGSETPPNGDRVSMLRQEAERLGLVAQGSEASLAQLVDALTAKRHRLSSSPAIWPTQGWLTSRFGRRISPFTGAEQYHAGIDIAGARGTDVVAPARGKVAFSGKRGPLGNSLIIDHGYGVRTLYGHNGDLYVKRGEEVARGQRIAALGSSGRSTGPHLHYVVEVNGKAKNPLDYIFD